MYKLSFLIAIDQYTIRREVNYTNAAKPCSGRARGGKNGVQEKCYCIPLLTKQPYFWFSPFELFSLRAYNYPIIKMFVYSTSFKSWGIS